MGAANNRQQPFAQNQVYIYDVPRSVMAASLIGYLGSATTAPNFGQFVTPPGLDLSPIVSRGNAVFMAWAENYAPAKANGMNCT